MGEIIYLNRLSSTSAVGQRFGRPALEIKNEEFIDDTPVKRKNAAEPIKDMRDIDRVIEHFTSTGQYRNNLIFVMGINFGLRCGDLLRLKVGHILDSDGNFRPEVRIQEQKTKKVRTCYMNDAIMDAAELYLSSFNCEALNLNDYLFTSLSRNRNSEYYDNYSYKEEDSPIEVRSVERMLKKTINEDLGIDVHAGTHLLRKTFGYHVAINCPDRSRAVEFLQKIFGHATQSITLAYIGITNEEIMNTCKNLNLGGNAMSIYYASGIDRIC